MNEMDSQPGPCVQTTITNTDAILAFCNKHI
ncbi:Uncharacterised protein [uncultured archaeon]|nr:Uncharacterised protein [uncultured archaeon]